MHVLLADPASGGGSGSILIGILLLVAVIGAALWYNQFKYRGFRARTVDTRLPADQLRAIFEQTVSGKGWSIVDDGNPIVAQSGLLAGIRQQIALDIRTTERGTHARICVLRFSKKVLGGPTKAFTLRWRMDAFLSAVRAADINATVVG